MNICGNVNGVTQLDRMLHSRLKSGVNFDMKTLRPYGSKDIVKQAHFHQESPDLYDLAGANFDQLHACFPGSKSSAKAFGDMASRDATSIRNDARLALYLSVAGDGDRKTYTRSFDLFDSEDADTVAAAMRFQSGTLLIHIEKDNTEIAALKAIVPWAINFPCRFHVRKYW